MTTAESPTAPTLARTLHRLYLARFGFAVVWALLLTAVSPLSPAVLTALLVLYALVDATSVLVELRAAEPSSRSRASELANVVLSVLAAVAMGWASTVSVGAVLTVWGAWAVASGATQLVTGAARRRMGGQWPLVASGGLSVLVGLVLFAQGLQGAGEVTVLAGYAVGGGAFFLLSAIRLARTRRAS
ncbi:hypothetical protein H1Q78_18790 [Cellulosimicrobium cellulans]|uniref:DUF308 domain-containing protein n=1 Tax=Cellulosimicrobium cellulans TaxID=1710 RepID=UPI001EDBC89A|nr:DUF308 domain-containing protein [Cellulosimicrobium cellulans]UKJ63634.1 hypothetical protein H1Q78_18790 [Cellulosimicrobium cellulans]